VKDAAKDANDKRPKTGPASLTQWKPKARSRAAKAANVIVIVEFAGTPWQSYSIKVIPVIFPLRRPGFVAWLTLSTTRLKLEPLPIRPVSPHGPGKFLRVFVEARLATDAAFAFWRRGLPGEARIRQSRICASDSSADGDGFASMRWPTILYAMGERLNFHSLRTLCCRSPSTILLQPRLTGDSFPTCRGYQM